jgi:hypothetical protein
MPIRMCQRGSVGEQKLVAILTKSDMEEPRTPSTLAKWWHEKYEQIRSCPEECKKARLHKGLYGNFVQEVYPLMLYASWRFHDDRVLCQPKIGSQGYDATISVIGEPDRVQLVEVTWPQDGKDHREVAKAMNEQGLNFRDHDDFMRYNSNVFDRVLEASRKKSVKDYRSPGGSALLIVCDTSCSSLFEGERGRQIKALVETLRLMRFCVVDSVYLITTPHEGVHSVKVECPPSQP